MAAPDPMDVDSRPSGNGDGQVLGEIEVKTATNDGGAGSHKAPRLDLSPVSKDSPLTGTDEQDNPNPSADSGYNSPPGNLTAHDGPLPQPPAIAGTSTASPRPASPLPIQDEIVCAPYCRNPLPKGNPRLDDGEPEPQFAPITTTKRRSSPRKVTVKTPDARTAQADSKLKDGDEEAAIPSERRNPKRTASAMAQPQVVEGPSHDDILEETLKPMEPEELEQWTGWIELESEPVGHPCSCGPRMSTLCGLN